MDRRRFLAGAMVTGAVAGAGLDAAKAFGLAGADGVPGMAAVTEKTQGLKPMAVGVLIRPSAGPAEVIGRVKSLGMNNCFLSLDDYIGKFNRALADEFAGLLEKNDVTATTVEVVGPGKLVWDFEDGPSTIGLVPRASRAARMDALKQCSDFAKMLGIPRVQTHCGFIPEDPQDAQYEGTVLAIRDLADYCAENGQQFLMETGQETPTTMLRCIQDVDRSNLGVGLDTANLILYGKANPSDALDIIGPHVKAMHAKDGKWPTDPKKLGEEVLIGHGVVDFKTVFTKLKKLGYTGAVTIERETSGPQQIADVRAEKVYLERMIASV